MIKKYALLSFALITLINLVGCQNGGPPYKSGPPAGWLSDSLNAKWWQADFDTVGAFKNLDSFEAMGVAQHKTIYGSPSEREMKEMIVGHVQERMISLYRSNPHVVDSLFTGIIAKGIFAEDLPRDGNVSVVVKRWTRNGYRRMSRHYREPRKKSKPAINPVYPDSLKYGGIGGLVHAQVSIDAGGNPVAIMLLQRANPTLDDLARQAIVQMKWQPAYLDQRPTAGLVRLQLNFAPKVSIDAADLEIN